MRPRTLTVLLTTALFASLVSLAAAWRLPGDNRGYEPVQPLAYSHRLHAGGMQIPCLYCHSTAERSIYAGIPATSICMNCHQLVTASSSAMAQERAAAAKEGRRVRAVVSPELRKLTVTFRGQPIPWVRVHMLPDFVRFDHSAHVTSGVACQTCHGPVESMERVRQVAPLTMGWCVDCHRDANERGVGGRRVNASLDCTTCHY